MTYDDAVKRLVYQEGYGPVWVARRLGVASQAVNGWFAPGKRVPPDRDLQLADIFKVDPAALRQGKIISQSGAPANRQDVDIKLISDHLGASHRSLPITEIDVETSAGAGSDDFRLDGEGQHKVLATWQIPENYLKSVSESVDKIRIIRVVGDSMEPDYYSGERVMVDTSHYLPSPPAVYVLFDGIGLYIKQLELIENSNPLRVRVSSRNPFYPPYEKDLADIRICGRVMGKWTWK